MHSNWERTRRAGTRSILGGRSLMRLAASVVGPPARDAVRGWRSSSPRVQRRLLHGGPDGKSWNGVIKAGDRFIRAQKLHRKSAQVYVETDSKFIFFLNSEDVRVPDMKCTVIEERRRRSTRNNSTDSASKSYKFSETEVELLKCRVHMPAIYDILNPA
jgi:hypothetical protein